MRKRGGFSAYTKAPASPRSWRVDARSGVRGDLGPRCFQLFCSLGFLEALVRNSLLSSRCAHSERGALRNQAAAQPQRRDTK